MINRIANPVKAFKNQELARKLILINCVLILVPLAAMGVYTFASFQKAMEKNVGTYQLQTLKQVTLNIDTYMNELDRLTLMPYSYKEVMDFISSERESGQPLTLEEIDSLNRFVSSIFINGRLDIMGVSLYGEKGASYVVLPESQYLTTYKLDESADWLKQARSRFGQPTFITTHEILSTSGTAYQVFSIARELRSFDTGRTLGYIVINIDPVSVRKLLQQTDTSEQEVLYIIDGQGMPVIRQDESQPVLELGALSGQGVLHSYGSSKDKQLIAYVTSEVTGWTTISGVPVKELMKDSLVVRNSIALALFICIGLAILASVVVAYRITLPLRKLSRLMRKVEQGELLVQFPVQSGDEVGRLGHSFNMMVSKLSELGYLLYETEIREKDAQIAALQFQINPHFLYNTLGSISMLAEVEGNREIVTMSNNLGRLMRYSLSNHRDKVTLRDELMHVNGYMSIQKIRYEERIQYIEHIDNEAYDLLVIPLSIQPLVENAINHGIDKGVGNGSICLRAAIHRNTLTIIVEDDGIGIDQESLEQLRKRLKTSKELGGQSGNGLLNVHRRILLHYGEGYGITLESMPYQGLKVNMTLPVQRFVEPPTI
ncbi:cache domain-containing sensor histidine kinase [Paenibacillus camelliae]|uniref:cache domain-containing sensor histidine kinase n=1 Tax=Paenibacillus camelliae TaxID=512410 RepID=UPI002041582C|nr:sensor histidine kinase [Paenibacillus camelliae]MCM3632080.1 sensor histidine kinase [Paenibacillus camelliae]